MNKFSNGGSRYREIRKPVVRDGKVHVDVVGKEDIQEYINSFADSCDVELIVQRATNGEPELLNQANGMYGDFTQFPSTYAEVLERVVNAQNLFESLPLEKRNNFNNDVFEFISSMDKPDWFEKAGFFVKKEDVKDEP